MIESQKKNTELAKEYNAKTPPSIPKQSTRKKKAHYTPEQKASWIQLYQKELKETAITQQNFAEKHELVFGVFHRWLETAGLTNRVRSADEIDQIIVEFRKSGETKEAFAERKEIPSRTFWAYLRQAGETAPRIKHTPNEIAQIVAEFHASKMLQKDFAQIKQIDKTTLRKWIAKMAAGRVVETNGDNEEFSNLIPGHKFTAEQVSALLQKFAQSGMTHEQFAKAKGIGVKTLHSWRKDAGMTEPRLTKEEIASHLDAFRKSGMSKRAFANSIGVGWATLDRWERTEPE